MQTVAFVVPVGMRAMSIVPLTRSLAAWVCVAAA
jgi:hypothetical protein